MTEHDAIKYLQDIDKNLIGDGVHAAICIAIEAIKKQIPQKIDGYSCSCGCINFINNQSYCPKCGQRLEM